jgi:ATP-dependent Lhr-like helicase
MLQLYETADTPTYLDATAQQLLAESRDNYHRWALHDRPLLTAGSGVILFPWNGDLAHSTIATLLTREGLSTESSGIAVTITDTNPTDLLHSIDRILDNSPPQADELADHIGNKITDKYDHYLGDLLLNTACAARDLDIPGAYQALSQIRSAIVNIPN